MRKTAQIVQTVPTVGTARMIDPVRTIIMEGKVLREYLRKTYPEHRSSVSMTFEIITHDVTLNISLKSQYGPEKFYSLRLTEKQLRNHLLVRELINQMKFSLREKIAEQMKREQDARSND